MRFRVSSQRCGGVQRGLNPKWLLLSQHSTVWPVVRIILGSVSGRYSEPSWTCGCGKFVGFSRRVAEESVENPAAAAVWALRRRRSLTRHWRFIMRGVVAALRLETLYIKSWEELTIRLLEISLREAIKNKIRKIYKFAFHVEQDHNINYPMGWGHKTI